MESVKKILKTVVIFLFTLVLLFIGITTTCIRVGNGESSESLLLYLLKEGIKSIREKPTPKEVIYSESELDSLQAVIDSLFGPSWIATQSFNDGVYFLDTVNILRINDSIAEFKYCAMYSDTLVVGNSIKYNINTLRFDRINKKIAPVRATFFSTANKQLGSVDKPEILFGDFFVEKQTETAVYKVLERVLNRQE